MSNKKTLPPLDSAAGALADYAAGVGPYAGAHDKVWRQVVNEREKRELSKPPCPD